MTSSGQSGLHHTRILATDTIREPCEIAEKYCDGYLRYTTRNNIEFLVSDEKKLEPLKKELTAKRL